MRVLQKKNMHPYSIQALNFYSIDIIVKKAVNCDAYTKLVFYALIVSLENIKFILTLHYMFKYQNISILNIFEQIISLYTNFNLHIQYNSQLD